LADQLIKTNEVNIRSMGEMSNKTFLSWNLNL